MKVRDALVPAIGTVTPEQPISEVARSIRDGGGMVAVMERGEPAGVVDGSDILRAVATLGGGIAGLKAADIMAGDMETIAHDSDLDQAWEHMQVRQLEGLAVLEDGQLLGRVNQQHQETITHDDLEAAEMARFLEGFEEGVAAATALSEESLAELEGLKQG